jgi:hypothetical protein
MITRPTNTYPEGETRHEEDKEIILVMNSYPLGEISNVSQERKKCHN